ncbi:MAG: hypothetical protein ACYSU3_05715 [Planctomycetota bacterium]
MPYDLMLHFAGQPIAKRQPPSCEQCHGFVTVQQRDRFWSARASQINRFQRVACFYVPRLQRTFHAIPCPALLVLGDVGNLVEHTDHAASVCRQRGGIQVAVGLRPSLFARVEVPNNHIAAGRHSWPASDGNHVRANGHECPTVAA